MKPTHPITCQRDGYTWQTRSQMPYVTCPYCRYKVKNPAPASASALARRHAKAERNRTTHSKKEK